MYMKFLNYKHSNVNGTKNITFVHIGHACFHILFIVFVIRAKMC